MNTLNPEICTFLGLIIIGFVIVIEVLNHRHYKWSQGDCDAHYYAWLNRRVTAEEIPDLGFFKLHEAILESAKCRCFKCGMWQGYENFTRPVWQMVNPEDAVCLSCTPCESHVDKYYEHLEWLEDTNCDNWYLNMYTEKAPEIKQATDALISAGYTKFN